MIGQDAAQKDTKQMKELRHRNENITGAHQIELSDHRVIVSPVQKVITRNNVCLARFWLFPDKWFLLRILILVVVVSMFLSIPVHIAEVDSKLLIVNLLFLWMWDFHPERFILGSHRMWRFTEELTMTRCRSSEYNTGHEPGRWNLTQEYQEYGT